MINLIKNWLHRRDKPQVKTHEPPSISNEIPKEEKLTCNCTECTCKSNCTPRQARKLSDEIPPAKNPRIKRG